MNPLLLKIADGTSFLVGMGMVIGASAPQLWITNRLARGVLTVVGLAGVLLVVLSSTPMGVGQYVAWFAFLAGTLIALHIRNLPRNGVRIRLLAVGLLVLVSLMLCLQELRYRWSPRIAIGPNQPIYVIGDSLSAGIGQGERVWPAVLADRSGLTVTNLAAGGAKVKDALAQAERIGPGGGLVLVEIGGNDLLDNGARRTDTALFRAGLAELLTILHRKGCQVALFELPLTPLANGYGRAQRTLASRYGATLIPKTYLAEVLGLPGGTIDGLHLSQKGHDHLAERVQELLHIVPGDQASR